MKRDIACDDALKHYAERVEKRLLENKKDLKAEMEDFAKHFPESMKQYIQSVDKIYLIYYDTECPTNQQKLLQQSWLLAHFGIVFHDLFEMDAFFNLLQADDFTIPTDEMSIFNANEDEFRLDPEALNSISKLINFYQVSNCGQAEANVKMFWNNIIMNLLMEIQRVRNISVDENSPMPSKKLVMESGYPFLQMFDIQMPVTADLVLKGLNQSDVPVCVVAYSARPIERGLHHKDVATMGVMLSSILLHRYNQKIITNENLNDLKLYGVLIEDFDFELCVAQLHVDSDKRFWVDYSCGRGKCRYNLFHGKLDISPLFREPVQNYIANLQEGPLTNIQLSTLIDSQILGVYDEDTNAIKLAKRTKSRLPNPDSLNVLVNFLLQGIKQNDLVESFPRATPNNADRVKYTMKSIFSKILDPKNNELSKYSLEYTQRSRTMVIFQPEKDLIYARPNIYIVPIEKESQFLGIQLHIVTLKENILTFPEHMTNEQYSLNDPIVFFASKLAILRDLILATYNMHQSGYVSLTYSRASIFWGGMFMLGRFETLRLLSETEPNIFSDLKRKDYVNLAEFVDKTFRFVSVLFSEFVPEGFEEYFSKIQKIIDILRYSELIETQIIIVIYDLYNEVHNSILYEHPYSRSFGHSLAVFQCDKLRSQLTGPIRIENIKDLKKESSYVIPGKTFDYSSEESEESEIDSDAETSETDSESGESNQDDI